MGRKDTSFGDKLQYLLVRMNKLNYTEVVMGYHIYIRYVVISIILITVMLAIELFYLKSFVNLLDVTLNTYLYLSLTGLRHFLENV